jgi:two-component system, NarL family, invasion response regulator UvrY
MARPRSAPKRLLIADDHPVVRQGLKLILAEAADFEVVGEARDGDEVRKWIRRNDWDMMLLDLTMPGARGLDLLKQVKTMHPARPVLVLSIHPEDLYAERVLRAGGAGYLNKESAPELLVEALRKVADGGKYVSANVAELLAKNLESNDNRSPHESLSDREFQVLRMIASGKTVSDIGEELILSVKTISTYRTRILAKMRLKNNAELTHYAISNRLVD